MESTETLLKIFETIYGKILPAIRMSSPTNALAPDAELRESLDMVFDALSVFWKENNTVKLNEWAISRANRLVETKLPMTDILKTMDVFHTKLINLCQEKVSGKEQRIEIADQITRGVNELRYAYLAAHQTILNELREKLEQNTYALQVLIDLSEQIGYSLNYEELAHLILSRLHLVVPHDVSASILIVDDSFEISLHAHRPISHSISEEIQQRLLNSLKRLSNLSGSIKKISINTSDQIDSELPHRPITILDSVFQVPIIVGQERRVMGLLFIGSEQENSFTEEHLSLLYSVANSVAMSIHRLRLLLAGEQYRLKSLIESIPEGLVLLDSDKNIVLTNPAAQKYLSTLTEAKEGSKLTTLGKNRLETVLQSKAGRDFFEIIVEKPTHRIFEVVNRRMETGPQAGGWILVIHEVTQQRKIQRIRQQQDRLAAVGQMVAGITHDFNNILTVIIGSADFALLQSNVPSLVHERLEAINSQGHRASILIRQLLDFSRESKPERIDLDIFSFLKELGKLFNRVFPENIPIKLKLDKNDYMIHADPTQIQQIVTNLIVNARDAMPEGGDITIQLRGFHINHEVIPPYSALLPGDWIALSLSDTGVGIPPEHLPRIFEPFFTTKEIGKGTGLGLSQVNTLVKNYNGFVDVKSKLGKGSTFIIYLPAMRKVPTSLPRDLEEIPYGKGQTILLVEDEHTVLEITKTLLISLGYRILTAINGKKALTMYEQHKDEISLIMTDIVLPGMTGLEMINALRTKNPEIKVIGITGYPMVKDERLALSQGFVEWLTKPVNRYQLGKVIKQVLKENER